MKRIQISGSWYFLIIVAFAYPILFFYNELLFLSSIEFFWGILINIFPTFIIVFALMALTNYFITPELIRKHLHKKGVKKWIFAIIGGIISAGPIYMWYPFLADLNKKGLSYGLIACFLYNRAIKIPLLPIAIFYFGWEYSLILCFVMVVMSIFQGVLIDQLIKNENSRRF